MKPAIERFLSKINVVDSGCWEWSKPICPNGYANFGINYRKMYAHRFIYEYYTGQLDPNLTIDHLCRNRKCVNPEHLEQVTMKENILRGQSPSALCAVKTHCLRGHEFTKENTLLIQNRRQCRKCCRIRCREDYVKNREKRLEGDRQYRIKNSDKVRKLNLEAVRRYRAKKLGYLR